MTQTEIENKIYDLKRVIESCENEIKKLEAEKEKLTFERVKEGNKYYTVAVEVADKINFLLKLERLHDTFCPDWNDKRKAKWAVVFDYAENKYASYWNPVTDNHTIVYFDSKETAEQVCKILNK